MLPIICYKIRDKKSTLYLQDVPNGLMNVSACKFNAPAFVSYPHFYKTDPVLLDKFENGSLNPSPDLHESQLSLEPISGVPLDVKVRMQINALVSPLYKEAFSEDGDYQAWNVTYARFLKITVDFFFPIPIIGREVNMFSSDDGGG